MFICKKWHLCICKKLSNHVFSFNSGGIFFFFLIFFFNMYSTFRQGRDVAVTCLPDAAFIVHMPVFTARRTVAHWLPAGRSWRHRHRLAEVLSRRSWSSLFPLDDTPGAGSPSPMMSLLSLQGFWKGDVSRSLMWPGRAYHHLTSRQTLSKHQRLTLFFCWQ